VKLRLKVSHVLGDHGGNGPWRDFLDEDSCERYHSLFDADNATAGTSECSWRLNAKVSFMGSHCFRAGFF